MKTFLLFLVTFFCALYFVNAQGWEIEKPRGPDGCYTTQVITTVEKQQTSYDKNRTFARIIFENPLNVQISFDFSLNNGGNRIDYGRITLKPGEKRIETNNRIIKTSELNIQPISVTKLKYENFDVFGTYISSSRYIKCLEHFHVYKKWKSGQIKGNNIGSVGASSKNTFGKGNEGYVNNDSKDNGQSTETNYNKNQQARSRPSTESSYNNRKQETEQEAARQAEEARKKKQEALKQERAAQAKRREQARQQEQAMVASVGAAQVGIMFVLGGFIYNNYGRIHDGSIYTNDNLYFGIDGGFGFSSSPIFYNADDSESDHYRFSSTLDLNTKIYFGYERVLEDLYEVGGEAYVGATAGLLPTGDTQLNYHIGGKVFGGLTMIKFLFGFEHGGREFRSQSWLSTEDFGSGKTIYSHSTFSYGVKFNFLDPDGLTRHHISLGILSERIKAADDIVIVRREQDDDFSKSILESKIKYEGCFIEWKQEHHGRLFFRLYPDFPFTGEINTSSTPDEEDKDGGIFFTIGFSRILEQFFKK